MRFGWCVGGDSVVYSLRLLLDLLNCSCGFLVTCLGVLVLGLLYCVVYVCVVGLLLNCGLLFFDDLCRCCFVGLVACCSSG